MKSLSELAFACSALLIISTSPAYSEELKLKAVTEAGKAMWLPQRILVGAQYVSYLPVQKRLIIIESGAGFKFKSYDHNGLKQSEVRIPDLLLWGSPFIVDSRLYVQLKKRGSDARLFEFDHDLSRLSTVEHTSELRIASHIQNSNQAIIESIRDWRIDLPWEGIDYDEGTSGSIPTGEAVLSQYPLLLGSPNKPRLSYQESPKIAVLLSEEALIGHKTKDKWKTLKLLNRDRKLSAALKDGTLMLVSTIIAKNRVKVGCLLGKLKPVALTIVADLHGNGHSLKMQKTTYLAVQNVLTLN